MSETAKTTLGAMSIIVAIVLVIWLLIVLTERLTLVENLPEAREACGKVGGIFTWERYAFVPGYLTECHPRPERER